MTQARLNNHEGVRAGTKSGKLKPNDPCLTKGTEDYSLNNYFLKHKEQQPCGSGRLFALGFLQARPLAALPGWALAPKTRLSLQSQSQGANFIRIYLVDEENVSLSLVVLLSTTFIERS